MASNRLAPAPDTPHETAGRMGQPRSSAGSSDRVEQVAEKIRELAGEALAVLADASSEVDVSRMVNTTSRRGARSIYSTITLPPSCPE